MKKAGDHTAPGPAAAVTPGPYLTHGDGCGPGWPKPPTPRRCFHPHQPRAEILMLGRNPPPLATGGQGQRPFPAGCTHSCSFLGEPAPTRTACGRSSRAHPTRPWGGLHRQWAHLPGKAQLHPGPSLTTQGTGDTQLSCPSPSPTAQWLHGVWQVT